MTFAPDTCWNRRRRCDPYHGFEAEGLAAQIGDLGLRLAFEALGDLLDRRGGVAVAHDFEKHLLGDGLLAFITR